MTVQELIAMLEAVKDKSQQVVVSGYEGGYSEVDEIVFVKLVLNAHSEWYYGAHDRPEELPDRKSAGKPTVDAIWIRH